MNFLHDTQKMFDFVTLSKAEFLKVYQQITEQEYDNTLVHYHLI